MEILAQYRLDGRLCSVLESSLAALRKFLCGMPSNPTGCSSENLRSSA